MTRHDLTLLARPEADLDWLVQGFAPLSLADLNAKAEMMERIDNKYIVPAAALAAILPDLTARFDILDIGHRRAFTYDTRYFDDAQHSAYYEHHQAAAKASRCAPAAMPMPGFAISRSRSRPPAA